MASPFRSVRVGMRIIRSPRLMAQWSDGLRREGVRIGLVPTMGALHAGHASLIRQARLTCDAVVVSLYVNPRQFGRGEDLGRYPRRLRADAALCRHQGVDVLFAPRDAAMYPPGFATSVSVPALSRRWEGQFRRSHFEGVATIVTKLLCIIMPDDVFFGRKDYQQSVVIRRLVADLSLRTCVRICPTIREPDGLAVSSRNEYLSPKQRRAAPVLKRALRTGRDAIRRGVREARLIRQAMVRATRQEPLAHVEYLAVVDPDSLEPLQRVAGPAVLIGAIRIGRVRLIDNLVVRAPRRR